MLSYESKEELAHIVIAVAWIALGHSQEYGITFSLSWSHHLVIVASLAGCSQF